MINQKLREAREQKHWSQEKAARETGLSKSSIVRWENGEQEPRGTSLEILCASYGKSAAELGFIYSKSDGRDVPRSAVQDGIITLTAEEARQLTLLLGLGDTTTMQHFDVSKRKTLQRLMAAASTAVIAPQLLIDAEPWERIATGKPEDIDATTLNHFEGLLISCRGLSNGSQLDIAEQILPQFLPRIVQLAPSQPKVASLAAQGLQLKSILSAHRLKLADKVAHCLEAVVHAKRANNANVLIASLLELAVAYQYEKKPVEALQSYQEALLYCKNASPVLQARAYIETAAALAKCARGKEALFYLGLAYDTLPHHPENDPFFAISDYCGYYTLSLYAGIIYIDLGKPGDALNGFERYKTSPSSAVVPERIRLEIVNHQGRAAILAKDMDQYTSCLSDGIAGAIALKSKKRFEEAYAIFQQEMPAMWLREMPIKQIVEQYHLQRA